MHKLKNVLNDIQIKKAFFKDFWKFVIKKRQEILIL